MTEQQRDWHRLFGMSWADFFTGTPVVVEMEKDLSIKQQLLPPGLPELLRAALLRPAVLLRGYPGRIAQRSSHFR